MAPRGGARQRSLVWSDVTGAHAENPPPRPASQGRLDAALDLGLIVVGGHDQRAKPGHLMVVQDLVVVRPATRPLVLPVATQLGGHRRPGRGRVGPLVEGEFSLDDERACGHSTNLSPVDPGRPAENRRRPAGRRRTTLRRANVRGLRRCRNVPAPWLADPRPLPRFDGLDLRGAGRDLCAGLDTRGRLRPTPFPQGAVLTSGGRRRRSPTTGMRRSLSLRRAPQAHPPNAQSMGTSGGGNQSPPRTSAWAGRSAL